MKNIILTTIFGIISLSLFAQQGSEHFYYYEGKKIFLQQRTEKLFIKFSPNANREQLLSLIDSYASLQATNNTNLESSRYRYAVLEAKDGKPITEAALESLKLRDEVVTATYLYQYVFIQA